MNIDTKWFYTTKLTSFSYSLAFTILISLYLSSCGGGTNQNQTNVDTTEDTQTDSSNIDNTMNDEEQSNNETPPDETQHVLKILPLGDSITSGGAGYPSYRRSLWFKLKKAFYAVDFIGSQNEFASDVDDELKDFDQDHEGHWAWEAGEIEYYLQDWLKNYKAPDIVLLHVGTNDVDRGQNNQRTITEINGIIQILRDRNPKVIILLATIIPMQDTDTVEFNELIEVLASNLNTTISPVVIVDQYANYKPLEDNHDNYHPNSLGEEKMAKKWLNALIPYLK